MILSIAALPAGTLHIVFGIVLPISNPVIKDNEGELVDPTSLVSGNQVTVYRTFRNDDDITRDFVMLIEIRDGEGITIHLTWQNAQMGPYSQREVGISWLLPDPGDYMLRTYAVSNLTHPQVLSDVETSEITVLQSQDEYYDETDTREIKVYSLLAADPRLAKYRIGVYGHSEDVQPLRKEPSGAWIDEAIMHVIKEQIVEGSWETGYTLTYKGITDVKMEVRSGKEILSIIEIPRPDIIHQYSFNDQDKGIIRAALGNSTVVQELQEKRAGGYKTYVNEVAYNGFFAGSTSCPPENCARVHFQVENTKQVMIVWLHSETGIVARMDLSQEWKNDCRQYACKES